MSYEIQAQFAVNAKSKEAAELSKFIKNYRNGDCFTRLRRKFEHSGDKTEIIITYTANDLREENRKELLDFAYAHRDIDLLLFGENVDDINQVIRVGWSRIRRTFEPVGEIIHK